MLEQTLAELASAGIEGLSIERIAQRAQVNKTTIYRRWPTREALVAAALESVRKQVAMGLPDTGSLRDDLIGLLTPVAEMLGQATGRALVRAALSEAAEASLGSVSTVPLAQQEAIPLRLLVARAQLRGEWDPGARADQLVFMLIGAMMHRAMLEHAPLTADWLASLVDLALRGVLPRSADPAPRAQAGGRRARRPVSQP